MLLQQMQVMQLQITSCVQCRLRRIVLFIIRELLIGKLSDDFHLLPLQ